MSASPASNYFKKSSVILSYDEYKSGGFSNLSNMLSILIYGMSLAYFFLSKNIGAFGLTS